MKDPGALLTENRNSILSKKFAFLKVEAQYQASRFSKYPTYQTNDLRSANPEEGPISRRANSLLFSHPAIQ